ncbi:MAG: hypothetical protein AAF558_11500 [Verrucomicrobiota bacterium]
MIRTILICLGIWGCAMPAMAIRVFIDFGDGGFKTTSPDPKGVHWNNAVWNGPGHTSPLSLKRADGQPIEARLRPIQPFFGGFTSGDNQQNLYPYNAGKDRWSLEKGKVEKAVIRFSKLSPSLKYTFAFFATRDAPIDFITRYSIGNQRVTLKANNNRNDRVWIKDVSPNRDGIIDVEVTIAGGPNGHLSVMEMTYVFPENQATSKANQPAPVSSAPKIEEAKSEIDEELAELGLDDEGNSQVFFILGIILMFLGAGVIGGSVWYLLKR